MQQLSTAVRREYQNVTCSIIQNSFCGMIDRCGKCENACGYSFSSESIAENCFDILFESVFVISYHCED